MSAQLIFDTAPLGALIRFSDGKPKPPSRFARKLASWEEKNGIGRLVRKEPVVRRGNHISTPSITLHHGDFASGGVVVLMAYTTYSVSGDLTFEIIERPAPGSIRVLHRLARRWSFFISQPIWPKPKNGSASILIGAPSSNP